MGKIRRFFMALHLAYQEQLYKRFDWGFDHPVRSLLYAHLEAFSDLWAILTIIGVTFGFIHIS